MATKKESASISNHAKSMSLLATTLLEKWKSSSRFKQLSHISKIALANIHKDGLCEPNVTNPSQEIEQTLLYLLLACELACETKTIEMISDVLEVYRKLAEFGYVKGISPIPPREDRSRKMHLEPLRERKVKTADWVISTIAKTFTLTNKTVHAQIVKTLFVVVSASFEIHGDCLLSVVNTCVNVYLYNTDLIENIASSTLALIVNEIFDRFEANENKNKNDPIEKETESQSSQQTNEKEDTQSYHSDCFQVFSLFCRLLVENSNENERFVFKQRTIAFEMLKNILILSKNHFIADKEFTEKLIKTSLVNALVFNCTHSNQFLKHILDLFVLLFKNYPIALGYEIDSFIRNELNPILETKNSPINSVLCVLKFFATLFADSEILLRLCVDSQFERIINLLVKIISKSEFKDASEDSQQMLVEEALRCFVSMLTVISDSVEPKTLSDIPTGALLWHYLNFDPLSHVLSHTQPTMKKKKLDECCDSFARSYRFGIECFVKNGFADDDSAQSTAKLITEIDLDKTKIGELFSINEEWNRNTLSFFIFSLDFKDLTIDNALLKLFSLFKIQNENESLDRILECFGEKYFQDSHQSLFESGKAVSNFARSVIHLSKCAHSLTRERLITFDDFFMQTKETFGFSEEFVRSIYDRLIKQHIFVNSNILFQTLWKNALTAFIEIFENNDNQSIIEICLKGFTSAIHFSSIRSLNNERNAFVSSLAKLTNLSSPQLRMKNILATRTVLSISNVDKDKLDECWTNVLQCLSQLARLHSNSLGIRDPLQRKSTSDLQILSDDNKLRNKSSFEKNSSRRISIDESAIDAMYIQSSKLTKSAFIHFTRSLCSVSAEELKENPQRLFSLQKIVEVIAVNVDRSAVVIGEAYKIVQTHFTNVICNQTQTHSVAVFAIDSLKQITSKLFEKDPLNEFDLQLELFKPFETIMFDNVSKELREVTMHCLHKIVQKNATNIDYGWPMVFSVLSSVPINHSEEHIILIALDTLTDIIRSHLQSFSFSQFVYVVRCVGIFALSQCLNATVNIRSVQLLSTCAQRLHSMCDLIAKDKANEEGKETDNGMKKETSSPLPNSFSILSLWIPLLKEFAHALSHANSEVRNIALSSLCSVLASNGLRFSEALWNDIFRGVVLPMYTNVSPDGKVFVEDEFLHTTCRSLLQSTAILCTQFFSFLSSQINTVIDLYTGYIVQENRHLILPSFASTSLFHLIIDNLQVLNISHWDHLCSRFTDICSFHMVWIKVAFGFSPLPTNNTNEREKGHEIIEETIVDRTICAFCSTPLSIHHFLYSQCLFCQKLSYCNDECRKKHFETHHFDCVNEYPSKAIHSEFLPQFSDTKDINNIEIVKSRVNIFLTNIQTIVVFCSKTPLNMTTLHYQMIFKLFDEIIHEFVLISHDDIELEKDGLKQLYLIEKEILSAYVQILFIMIAECNIDSHNRREIAKEKIFSELMPTIANYLENRDGSFAYPVVALFIKCLLNLSDEQYLELLPRFYGFLKNLIIQEDDRLVKIVREHFVHIGKLKKLIQ